MTERYLRHITLTSGHVRDSLPGEVSVDAIAACRALIAPLRDDAAPIKAIPGVGRYSLGGRASGQCLVAIVYADGPPSLPICTIGVAAHSRCGARLWRNLHIWGDAPVVTDPDRCPAEPWVAAALDAAIVDHQDATAWLGDFERCLGWAWLAELGR